MGQHGILSSQRKAPSKPHLKSNISTPYCFAPSGPTKKFSQQDIGSIDSLTADLSLSPKPTPTPIYQYERSLSGITGILYKPRPHVPSKAQSLGDLGDQYVQAHGYNESSIRYIHEAFGRSNNVDDFTDYLCQKGLPERKAQFLWILINGHI
jgi:hypothetical protein